MSLAEPPSVTKPALPREAAAQPSLDLQVSEGGRFLTLSGEAILGALEPLSRLEFIQRLFASENVRSVLVDPSKKSVRLRLHPSTSSPKELIEKVAKSLRKADFASLTFSDHERLPAEFFARPFEVWRIGEDLTLWRIQCLKHKQYRLWHPLLRRPAVREIVLDRLAIADTIPLSSVVRTDDSILIHCHSPKMTEVRIKKVVDAALQDSPPEEDETKRIIPRETLLHVNLVTAGVADFLFPPLGVANIAMVYLVNKDHWPAAIRDLQRGRTNVHLVYLTIGTLTVISFEFFAASSMYWLMHFWPKWTQTLRRKSQRRLLSHYQRVPSTSRVQEDGQITKVGLLELKKNAEIVLQRGDVIPGDGVITLGTASIDESWVRGLSNQAPKGQGDRVYAATRVLSGEIRMHLQALGHETEAAKIANWHRCHLACPRVERDSEADRLADAISLPVLLVGILAMTRGGITMTKAVIRPDYRTGNWITEELVDLQAMKRLAPSGVVVIQPEALHQITETDCAIFDDSVDWIPREPGQPSISESLREQGVTEVILLSEQSAKEASRLAKEWGFDDYETGMNPNEKMSFIKQRRQLGRKVVYFGDCQKEPAVAEQANLAISVAQIPYPEHVSAPVILLQPDLQRCVEFLAVSMNRNQVLQNSLNITLASNLAAVAGGLYLGTSVGTSVILSNLGTLVTYLRLRRSIL